MESCPSPNFLSILQRAVASQVIFSLFLIVTFCLVSPVTSAAQHFGSTFESDAYKDNLGKYPRGRPLYLLR